MGAELLPERLKKVAALREMGHSLKAISKLLNISQASAARYWAAYQQQAQAQADILGLAPDVRPEPPTTQEKVLEIQKNIAGRCLSTAQRLVGSLDHMSDGEMKRIPVSQRAIAAGILVDKARLLNEQSTENISLKNFSWVQLVGDSMPRRAKDDLPEAGAGKGPEEQQALPEGVSPDEDFLK